MKDIINEAELFAFSESLKFATPIKQHIDLARTKGVQLAEKLSANKEIVEVGTLLMDCIIGQAISENRLKDHVQMSADKTIELLARYDLEEKVKENITQCVLQHHGGVKFYSLEAEICCNADCYRFCSVEGLSYVLRYFRDMPFIDLVALMNVKVEEKWNAISLDIVKQELAPQYKTIKEFLVYLQ